MVTALRLRADPVAALAGYHSFCARIICRFTVTAATSASSAGLKWLGVLAVVLPWMFGGVGWHATSYGAELSFDIYIMLVYSGCGYYRGNIRILWKYSQFVITTRKKLKHPNMTK